jgi:hypothetical protein
MNEDALIELMVEALKYLKLYAGDRGISEVDDFIKKMKDEWDIE